MKIKLIVSISILSSFSLSSAMSETPDEMLNRALKAGDTGLKLAEKAIKLGANVNAITFTHNLFKRRGFDADKYSAFTLLIQRMTASYKIKNTIILLLESGIDINIKDGYGRTLLDGIKFLERRLLEQNLQCIRAYEKIDIEEIYNLIQNTEVISKEKAEKLKKEINEHLLPDISDMIIQYAYLVKKELKKDSDKEVSSLSIY